MTRQILPAPCDEPAMNSSKMHPCRGRLAALALVLIVVPAACSSDSGSDVATSPEPTAEAVEPTTALETTSVAPVAMDLPSDGSDPQPEPGVYHLGAIGLPSATFEIGDGWRITQVAQNGDGAPFSDEFVRVTDASGAIGRRDLHFSRPTNLLDPAFIGPPRASVLEESDLWEDTDIRAWLAEAETGGEWGVLDVEEIEVSGRSAVTFTLQPDFVGCEGMEALAPGIRDDWTGCNGGIAWDVETEAETGGRIAVESWDGGLSEFLWIDDVDGRPLVVTLQFGYDIDEDWTARARAVLASLTLG